MVQKRVVSKAKTKALPSWLSDAMQGICYWVGHRRSYYRHYSLMEGAIVAELANLIHSQIGSNDYLFCEVPYKDLNVKNGSSNDLKTRLDLLVSHEPVDGKYDSQNLIAIEVKRGTASMEAINQDIIRLANLKRVRPEIATFLMIVSENKLPTQRPWIKKDEDGTLKIMANSLAMDLADQTGKVVARYKVRRVCKALASTQPKSGHTAILVEVMVP